jgi:hypothetical protein
MAQSIPSTSKEVSRRSGGWLSLLPLLSNNTAEHSGTVTVKGKTDPGRHFTVTRQSKSGGDWAWWFMPVILTVWEAAIGDNSSRPTQEKVRPYLKEQVQHGVGAYNPSYAGDEGRVFGGPRLTLAKARDSI